MNPKHLLDHYQIAPRKSLGQNFLIDPNTLDKIADAATLMPTDTVIEVGAGTGALTERLAALARRVIALELDERMKPILAAAALRHPNIELVYGDVLTVNLAALLNNAPYSVCANVPYYITSAIIKLFLEAPHKPQHLVLTVQAEVAERIIAAPNDMSILAVSVQYYAKPKIVTRLSPSVFYPRPDVASAVLRLDVYDQPIVDTPDDKMFFRVVKAGFSQKRKQLKNSLGALTVNADAILQSANIDPRRRAETLTLAEWAALTRAYAAEQA